MPQQRSPERTPLPRPEVPLVDEVCVWLSAAPSLDEVAKTLRGLRVAHSELASCIELLRRHVLAAMGDSAEQRLAYDDHPF